MDILRTAQKGDPHAGPDRLRFHRKLGALALQLRDDIVDPADAQPDMLEPEIRRLRRCSDGLLRRNLGDEHGYPAEIEVEARPAVRLHRADDLGTEHPLVPACGRFRIGAAQMDVVVGEGGHASLPLSISGNTLGPGRVWRQQSWGPGAADGRTAPLAPGGMALLGVFG